MKDDEISLKLHGVCTKLVHEVEPGWSRGKKEDFIGVFPTGAVVKLFNIQMIELQMAMKMQHNQK